MIAALYTRTSTNLIDVVVVVLLLLVVVVLLVGEVEDLVGEQRMPLQALSLGSPGRSFSVSGLICMTCAAFHYCNLDDTIHHTVRPS